MERATGALFDPSKARDRVCAHGGITRNRLARLGKTQVLQIPLHDLHCLEGSLELTLCNTERLLRLIPLPWGGRVRDSAPVAEGQARVEIKLIGSLIEGLLRFETWVSIQDT